MVDSKSGGESSLALLDYVKAGVIVYDAEARIRYANAEADRILGLPFEQLDGVAAAERGLTFCAEDGRVFRPEELPVHRVLSNTEPVLNLVIGVVQPGLPDRRWALVSAFPQEVNDGTPTRVVLTFVDITGRREAELRREHLTKVLRAIRNVSQLIAQERDRSKLLQRSCALLTETRGYTSVWIAARGEDGKLRAEAQSGIDNGFEALIEQMEAGFAPACIRQLTQDPELLVVQDRSRLCAECPIAKDVRNHGVLARPLRSGERDYGILVAVLPAALAGDEEEQSLFREVARDIGFALGSLEAEEARSAAEEGLVESKQKLETALDNMNDAVFISDAEGSFINFNDAFASFHRFEHKEQCTNTFAEYSEFLEVFFPDGRLAPVEQWAVPRALRGESATNAEYLLRRTDTGETWLGTYSFAPLRDETGAITGSVVVARDITQQRRAEADLRESQARFSAIFNTSPIGINIFSLEDGLSHDANAAFLEITGYARNEVVGHSAADLGLFVDPDVRRAWMSKLHRGQSVMNQDAQLRRKSGEIRDLLASLDVIDVDGERMGLVMTADITERSIAEAALKESEDRFRALVENAPDGIYVQHHGRFLFANPAMTELLGASSAGELIGAEVASRLAPEYRDRPPGRVRSRADTAEAAERIEQEFLRADGSRVPVETSAVGLRYQGRDAALVFVRDISARREAEAEQAKLQEQLLQAQKIESVGRLAGGVAHDFNNLLTVQRGYCEILRMGLKENDPLAKGLAQIDGCAVRASELTRQLLAFSRKQALAPRIFDMNSLVQGLDQMLHTLIGEDIELVTTPAPNEATVKADPGQIEQVLVNLAVNARDAMASGGTLRIEVGLVDLDRSFTDTHREVDPGPYVMLAVSDTGTGMDDETTRQIFEPFFTTKAEGVGTGLGLSTAYGIVRQSGGTIWVYSELGRGTTFKVYLPRVYEKAPSPSRTNPATKRGHGELVLVVEDEPALRELAQMMIDNLGYRTATAANGGEALLQIEERGVRPDLVLSDVVLPGMSGRVLVERLKRTLPDMKVIYMSGYTDDAVMRHRILASDIAFLQKPFTVAALAEKLTTVLEGR